MMSTCYTLSSRFASFIHRIVALVASLVASLVVALMLSGFVWAAEPEAVKESDGVVTDRLKDERKSESSPYVFLAHKQNYILPVSYTTRLNSEVYDEFNESLSEYLRSEEVKFQLSVKLPLIDRDLLVPGGRLFAGFTLEAWWQLYSTDVSSPFRETNYQPEIFFVAPMSWQPFGGKTIVVFGLEHQSNGQIQGISRSWNRLYASLLFERGNFFALVRPWYRLPESEKEEPESPKGDDNPDILDFMGYSEFVMGWQGSRYKFRADMYGNTSTGNGGLELSMSFPLFKRFRGVVNYFNGYGDSLVDYNHKQQRFGLGVLLSNLF